MVNSGRTPYITFTEPGKDGEMEYFILQKEFPHHVAVIRNYPVLGSWSGVVINHNLWVVWHSTLRGNLIPSYMNMSDEIQTVVDSMANWFYNNRVLVDEKRYKKFKINV